jgi:hypothetical protein
MNISDMLSEELDIESDGINLENEEESAVKNRAAKCRKVRVRMKQVFYLLTCGKM